VTSPHTVPSGELPAAFVREIVERESDAGRAWLQTLPELATWFLNRWDCVRDGAVRHGAVGLVVPVLRRAQCAVLKISFPHPGNRSEPFALATWGGVGAVRLLDREDDHFAMLLERAGPATLASIGDNEQALRLSGELARTLAVPAPATVPRLGDTAGWEEQLRRHDQALRSQALHQPLPRPVLDRAIAIIQDLSHDQTKTLIHGDLHYANVLSAEESHHRRWLAIDPKGLAGTAAFDAATLVWERLDELDSSTFNASIGRRLSIFAEAAAVDLALTRDCTFARTVSAYQYELLRGRPERAASVERLMFDGLS
jgi:streptomycin 6-kinase